MLIAKLTIALGILLTLPSAWVIYAATKAIPHAGSGVDAPILIRFVAAIILAFGALLLIAGLIALRWPNVGRWAIVFAGAAPFLVTLIFSHGALNRPMT
jgi:hypothetical protein